MSAHINMLFAWVAKNMLGIILYNPTHLHINLSNSLFLKTNRQNSAAVIYTHQRPIYSKNQQKNLPPLVRLHISFAVALKSPLAISMETIGLEPTTSALQTRRSPNWATSPSLLHRNLKFEISNYSNGPGKIRTSDLTLIRRAL